MGEWALGEVRGVREVYTLALVGVWLGDTQGTQGTQGTQEDKEGEH